MGLSSLNPTERFTERVDNYVRYRPTYPPAIIPYLRETIHLNRKTIVADIGSGTGIFTDLLLKHGFTVIGVEPNQAMRAAGENFLQHYPHFSSVQGTAEATTLANQSVDFITVAQAFHWMDPEKTKVEFSRILKPQGHTLLIWNVRLTDTAFLQSMDELKRQFGKQYEAIHSNHADETQIRAFFAPKQVRIKTFRHAQILDYASLRGQLLSSSYMPQETEAGYEEMIKALEDVFQRYQENAQVNMEYETKLFLA